MWRFMRSGGNTAVTNQTNKRRGGFYWINERPYVSVTEVIKVISKPALRYWYGKEVYYAMCQDPTLSEKEALAAPWKKSGKAKTRGLDIHAMVEGHKRGAKLPEEFVGDGEFVGYGNAYLSFLEDHPKFAPVEHERTVVSSEHGYAGTLDLVATLGERRVIIDVKTNKDARVYDEVELQLSAYSEALGGDLPMFCLALGSNGQYTLKQTENRFDEFLAAKKLWEWKNQSKLKTVGYYQEGLFDAKD